MAKLKDELNKTNKVLLNVIDYIGRDDISGISQNTNKETPKAKNDEMQPITEEPIPKKDEAMKKLETEESELSHMPSSDDE